MVKIIGISKEILPEAWRDAEPFIQKALGKANGEMSIKDVYNWIEDDKYILLMAIDEKPLGAVTLEIQDYPQKRKLGVVHVGGECVHKWHELMWDAIKRIAKDYEADSINWIGRAGWERFMKGKITKSYFVGEVEL